MSKAKKWVGRIISVFLILVFAAGAYVFITVLTSGDKVPTVFGYSFLKVSTGSMEPTLKTGSIIIVKSTVADEVRAGDIICFYSRDPKISGIPNTHRVNEISEDDGRRIFITKGDANYVVDEYPVYGEDIVGVYVTEITSSTKIASIVQSRYFFFFVLLIPLCLVVFFEAMNVSKTIKDKKSIDKQDGADERKNNKE